MYEKEKTMIEEQHMQDLLETRLQIQEQTMQDIGREIHDNIGQKLTLAAIYANQLSFEKQYPEIQERITAVGKIINESLTELRSMSKNLANVHAESNELKTLIKSECNRVQALQICNVSCSFSGSDYILSGTVKSFLVRIVQEFMQNSLKHSGCQNINITFNYTNEGLKLAADDDGKGFNTGTPNDNGIGLQNMRKRAELLSADFNLRSAPGKGTYLELFIPSNKLNN